MQIFLRKNNYHIVIILKFLCLCLAFRDKLHYAAVQDCLFLSFPFVSQVKYPHLQLDLSAGE